MRDTTSTTRHHQTGGRTWIRAAATLALAASLSVGCGSARTLRPATTDDSSVSTRVRTVLLNDPQVNGGNINVTASNGVVTLSGRVRSEAERERAVALARQTSGVSDVRSELAVTQP
jgi:hyperosmotically inducible periplasmic protein